MRPLARWLRRLLARTDLGAATPRVAAVAVALGLFALVQVTAFPAAPAPPPRPFVLIEVALVVASLAGLALVDSLRTSPGLYRPLAAGLGLFALRSTTDVFDEFVRTPEPYTFVFEDLLTLAALAALVVALGRWAGERDRREAQLRERERRLEAQNARLEQFASLVSHDLRNPLQVAQTTTDLVRADLPEAERERLERSHERMATLIEDIRDLVRLGQDSVETEPVGLDAAARTAWQTVDTSGGTLRTDGQTTVEADPDLLAQLFENLYGNAVEHGSTNPDSQTRRDAVGQASDEPSVADAPEDAVEHGSTSPGSQTRQDAAEHGSTDPDPGHTDSGVTVTVGAIDGGGFYVADDGPGIPPEEREAVFDLGVSENGTGLGLAIVRRIADAHDWTATVTESETGGARFEFRPAPDAADPDTTVSPR